MILIDGALLEGGGQVVRLSSCLSALMKVPIRIHSIRAGRPKPGLAAQHLAGIKLIAAICAGSLEGAELGSTEVEMVPGQLLLGSREYLADAKTAGATTLLFQSALPICFLGSSSQGLRSTKLVLKGGTNVPFSPQFEYLKHVLVPNLKKLVGLDATIKLCRRGVFPKGGGTLEATVASVQSVPGFSLLERGRITGVRGFSWACGAGAERDGEMMLESASRSLRECGELGGLDVSLERSFEAAGGKGAGSCYGTVLWAETECGTVIGGTGLAGRGSDPASCGIEAAQELIREIRHQGCVDTHMQDQIIVFMALSDQPSEIRCGELSQHTKTAIHFAQVLTSATFTVTNTPSGAIIACSGGGKCKDQGQI